VAKKPETLSIIDKGMNVDGKIKCDGKLIIKGEVNGDIESETVIIAREGVVNAKINVGYIVIGGAYEGELRASGVMKILSTGKCSGKVWCKDIVVENGSMLNANVDCSLTE